jgi:small subunit ribosomal protein S26e
MQDEKIARGASERERIDRDFGGAQELSRVLSLIHGVIFTHCEYHASLPGSIRRQIGLSERELSVSGTIRSQIERLRRFWPAFPMPQKRRNCGRAKMNAGRKQTVNCLNCGRFVPRDKAIKRFGIKQIVDASSQADVKGQTIYSECELPKTYQKTFYCVSCAVHRRIVRVRSVIHRRERLSIVQKKRVARAEEKATRTNEARAAE